MGTPRIQITFNKETIFIFNPAFLYDFKISFRNQYNYFVTILPFTNDNNEINFITDIKK